MAKHGKGKLGETEQVHGNGNGSGELEGLDIDFNAASSSIATKYPWDKWFDGNMVAIKFGRDYGTTVGRDGKRVLTQHMFPKIKTAARHKYKICLVLRASRADDTVKAKLTSLGYTDLGNTLILKARPMMADERIAEDKKRAEEKVRKAELAAEKAAQGLAPDAPTQDEIDAAA